MSTDAQTISLKKAFLYTLIGSIACSALLGIGAVALGDFGEVEVRILLTTLTIAGASICGLSCGAVLEAGRASVLPSLGVGLSLLGAGSIILGLWGEFSSPEYWKATATFITLGVACSHASLLLLARLSPQYHWSFRAAHLAISLVAGLLISMLWGEFDDEGVLRMLGVASIVAAALTILIPVFHRLSRGDFDQPTGTNVVEVSRQIDRLERQLEELRTLHTRLTSPAASAGSGNKS